MATELYRRINEVWPEHWSRRHNLAQTSAQKCAADREQTRNIDEAIREAADDDLWGLALEMWLDDLERSTIVSSPELHLASLKERRKILKKRHH